MQILIIFYPDNMALKFKTGPEAVNGCTRLANEKRTHVSWLCKVALIASPWGRERKSCTDPKRQSTWESPTLLDSHMGCIFFGRRYFRFIWKLPELKKILLWSTPDEKRLVKAKSESFWKIISLELLYRWSWSWFQDTKKEWINSTLTPIQNFIAVCMPC